MMINLHTKHSKLLQIKNEMSLLFKTIFLNSKMYFHSISMMHSKRKYIFIVEHVKLKSLWRASFSLNNSSVPMKFTLKKNYSVQKEWTEL